MYQFYHSATIDPTRCKGCTHCIKICPMEAVRLRNGKAYVMETRCIDCGECIKQCPNRTIKTEYNRLDDVLNDQGKFRYKAVIPDSALFGQFKNLNHIDIVKKGLLDIGFDGVFPTFEADHQISKMTNLLLKEKLNKPVISSHCPAVVRLISMRFPDLCAHVLPILSAAEITAQRIRRRLMRETGLPGEQIGIFYIAPCPAKISAVTIPNGKERSDIDCALSMADVYRRLVNIMKPDHQLRQPVEGLLRYSFTGGHAKEIESDKVLVADGIRNVIGVLELMEDDKLYEFDYVELDSCSCGCLGGALNAENAYVARHHLTLLDQMAVRPAIELSEMQKYEMTWKKDLEFAHVLKLDEDLGAAMNKLNEIEKLTKTFPGLDCGSCGAPSCRALAEDIVRGYAKESDCIFKMRQMLHDISGEEEQVAQAMRPIHDEDQA